MLLLLSYLVLSMLSLCFFFNATATTEIYTLSLHDALPISGFVAQALATARTALGLPSDRATSEYVRVLPRGIRCRDRKSTRLNSSHLGISYAVFCLKKKKEKKTKRKMQSRT